MVHGQRNYIYFERSASSSGNMIGQWFVERKVPVLSE